MPFPYWVTGVPFSWYLILSAVLFALGRGGLSVPPQYHHGVHVH